MITLYIGGIGKSNVKRLLEQRSNLKLTLVVSNDLAAGPILQRIPNTYYIGTCHTGAGGALGAMSAFLGRQRCHTFGRQAHVSATEMQKLLDSGVRVFGVSVDQISTIVPSLVDAIQVHVPVGEAS